MSQILSRKEEIAQSLVRRDNSARTADEIPPVGSYRCLVCGHSMIGEISCISHVMNEHDVELESEMRVKI